MRVQTVWKDPGGQLRLARAAAKNRASEDQGLIYASTKTASQLCPRDSSHTCLTQQSPNAFARLKGLALELGGSRFDSQPYHFLVA